MMDDQEVYALIGEDGFNRLVSAFYSQISTDDILGPMYPKGDMEGAEFRLREFLIYRFGGPDRYLGHRGHPRLRMRHHPFHIDQAARNRWIQIMDKALAQTNLPAEAEEVMRAFFDTVATHMINHE